MSLRMQTSQNNLWPVHWTYTQFARAFLKAQKSLGAVAIPVQFQRHNFVFYAGHEPLGVFVFDSGQGYYRKGHDVYGELIVNEPLGLMNIYKGECFESSLIITSKASGLFYSKNDVFLLMK